MKSFLAAFAVVTACSLAACGSDEDSNGFSQNAGYVAQEAGTQPPLPPGAGPYDGGPRPDPPMDSGTVVDSGNSPDTGAPADAGATDSGPKDAAAGG
jgi:hypothetical protein